MSDHDSTPSEQARTQKRKRRKRIFRIFLFSIWGGFLLAVIGFYALIYSINAGVFGPKPSTEQLENPQSFLATQIFSADGEVVGRYFKENRTNVRYDEIPPHLVDALVATEDIRFYRHSGIDFRALGRVAFFTVLLQRDNSGGGSTISQQLAKNLFDRKAFQTTQEIVIQKLKEWVIATELERRYTKEEIITMYLNTVEFVNLAHGIRTAAQIYFNKTPDSLTIEEGALLVGMVKNPSLYNPVRNPEGVRNRRNVVLSQMTKYGYLSQAEYDSLKLLDLGLDYQKVDHNRGLATYFREHLRKELKEWSENNPRPDGTVYDIYRDGLKIYTTIDARMQEYAEKAADEHMAQLADEYLLDWKGRKDPWMDPNSDEKYDKDFLDRKMKQSPRYKSMVNQGFELEAIRDTFAKERRMRVFSWKHNDREADTMLSPLDSIRYMNILPQVGFVVADPHTGDILAWVGGIDHRYFKLNHATTRRQTGSTFKPFVYTQAIKELKYSPCHPMWNTDVVFEDHDDWSPQNSSDDFEGEKVELRMALAKSINKITAKLIKEIGTSSVIDLCRKMGIEAEVSPYPPMCLGTSDISVYEMVGAYTTYVNRGFYQPLRMISRIEDKHGNVIYRGRPEPGRNVLDEATAYVMLQFLKDVVALGTGRRLRFRYNLKGEMGGKTGTTQDHSDGWYMGVTPDLVAGCWVGFDEPVVRFRSIARGQGANTALPVFGRFMQQVYADPTLGISEDAVFQKPLDPIGIELDCERYKEAIDNIYDNLDGGGNDYDREGW